MPQHSSQPNSPANAYAGDVAAAKQGDMSARERLFTRLCPTCIAKACRMVKPDDVLDVVQETFYRAFKQLNNLRNDDQFVAWLWRTLANVVHEHWRKKLGRKGIRRTVSLEDFNLVSPDPGVADAAADTEMQRLVVKSLSVLRPEEREAILLFYWDDMPMDEIAQVMGASYACTNTRIDRGRRHLARIIGAHKGAIS